MTLLQSKSTPVLDFTSHGHESLLHISGILGTGLQEWDANLISKGLHKFSTWSANCTRETKAQRV